MAFDRSEFYHCLVAPPWLDLAAGRCETEVIRAENMPDTRGQIVTVGVTGASGAILAHKTLALLEEDVRVARVHLVVTEAGQRLLAEELGLSSGDIKQLPTRLLGRASSKIEILPNKDVGASIASGSYSVDAMLVVPCSMGTLAAVASGTSEDLVARAADVMLKEGRKLVLCVRDTPFSHIHLENMLRALQAGAVIMPAVLSYYHQPKTIDDLVTQYICRVLAQIGLPQEKMFRWTGTPASKKAGAEG
jgi:4-hydroxy-3-polyprenylbenzoate decarboxylase